MIDGWQKVKIGDCFELVNGFAFKSKEFINEGIPVIKIKNIKASYFSKHEFSYVSEDFLKKRSNKLAQKGDLLISMSGNRYDGSPETWVGKIALFNEEDEYFINQRVGALRAKDVGVVDPRFANYILGSFEFQYWFISIATSSGGQANISPTQVLDTSFKLPPIEEQKAIAHILGTLDDKIELNRKMNQTLEAMAQALFKSWFVDFDPVLDKALANGFFDAENPPFSPESLNAWESLKAKAEKRKLVSESKKLRQTNPELAKQFPSAFEFNETLGKWIPEGWEVKSLGELSNVISKGTTPRKVDLVGLQESIPFIKVRDMDDNGNLSYDLDLIPKEIHLSQLKRSILKKDDLIFSIAGTIGRVAIVPSRLDNSNCNQAVAFIRLSDKTRNNILVHQFLRSANIQGEIHSKVVQAVQANTSLKNLSDLKIILSSFEIIKEFNDAMNSIYNRSDLSKEQSETLTHLRDTLLPKLISGEVRVPMTICDEIGNEKLNLKETKV